METKRSFKKTLQRSEDCFVQFTEEELSALNIKPGDKFSCKVDGDCILLDKFVSLDIDLSEWSREVLEFLIAESIQTDKPVNDIIIEILEKNLKNI